MKQGLFHNWRFVKNDQNCSYSGPLPVWAFPHGFAVDIKHSDETYNSAEQAQNRDGPNQK